MPDSVFLAGMYGPALPTDPATARAWVEADHAAGRVSGLYADMQQFEAVSAHPWPYLLRAYDQGIGLELTAAQVRELLAEHYSVIEKNNELLSAPGER